LNFMGTDKELLLAHRAMSNVNLTHDVNVMLTPQFYTLKKEALPVQYAYQAKRIAPSLFEGLLERDSSYEYMVWKEEGEWVFLAYDIKMITEFLESKGFDLTQVSKLFFAQQSEALFAQPLLVGESTALISLNKSVVLVPKVALEGEVTSSTFNNSFTPPKGIVIESAYGALITAKQTSVLAAAFILFALMFIAEGWRYSNGNNAGAEQLEELFESYPDMRSSYTRDSIISKYKTLDTQERRKRDITKIVSGMIFKGVTLSTFNMDEKKFSVAFSCDNAKVVKRVKELAKKNKLKTTSLGNDVKVEGQL